MKRISATIFILTLTILASFQTPLAQSAGTSGPNIPELPDWTDLGQGLTHRVNRSDLFPSNFRHNYTGGSPQLLQFRTMVMQVNCTRNMTINITSDGDVNVPYLAMNARAQRKASTSTCTLRPTAQDL